MRLPKPSAPFSPVCVVGESITVDTAGKVLVLPTGNPDILPAHNEYVLSSRRLSLEDYPWGGVSDFPDYAPGTLYTPTDGIYLTDLSGTNSTKTLTAGKLAELGNLTVDTTAHSITEEFIVANISESNNPVVIDACDSTDGWKGKIGTSHVISVENGRLKVTGVSDTSGRLTISKSINADLSAYSFLYCTIQPHENGSCYVKIVTGAGNEHLYTSSRFPIVANSENRVVLPINPPQGSIGSMPYFAVGTFNPAGVTSIEIGVNVTGASTEITFYVDNITADTAKTATIEAHVPDNLSATSLSLYTHNGTAYQLCSTHSLDGAYSQVSQTSANCTFLDGTKLDDVYGAGLGRAVFPKGSAGDTKAGSSGNITYSENRGTDKRIGLTFNLPPSDGGRTNFNKIRLKTILTYTDTVGNVVPDLSGNGNHGTIVGGVTKLTDGGLLADGSTGYVSTTRKLTVSNGITLYAQFKTSNALKSQCLFDCGGGVVGRNGVFVYLTSTGSLQIWITASGSATYRQADIVGVISTSTEYTLLLSWDGKIGTNNISVTLNGNTTTYSSDNTYSGESFSACTLLAYTTTPPNHSGFATIELHEFAISESVISDPRNNSAIHYTPTVQNMGSTTHEFADSTNASYGLHHMVKPWIALLEDDTQEIDFYLFDERPKNLKYKQDESGKIYELEVFPGNGNCYHGRIKYSGLTRDTNSDGIPDCLDASVEGSIANFLRTYDFAKDWYYEYDLSASAISANDFSITEESLDIVPFAVPEGDSVSDTNNVILPVAETVSTATGNVSLVDVRGLSAVRVRDTSYTNSGECKVWDTVTAGNTDVATWIRVYNTNWVFSGDKVIENGIIRILYSSTATYSCKLYYHNGSSWVYDRYIRIGVGGSYNSTISTVNFQTISSDAVSLTLRLSGYDQYPTDIHYVNINLIRGVYSAKFTILDTSVINGAGVRIYDETGTVNPLVCTNTIHDFRFSETDSSYYLSDSSGLGYSLNTSGGAIRFQCDPKTTNMRYRLVGTTRYCYGIVYNDDAPYSIFVGAIPYSQQMYWEAESLTGYGITVVSDVDTYSGQAVEIRRPIQYNNHITVNLTGMCVANQKIKIYVRAKCPLADKLQLYVHSASSSRIIALANPVLTIGSYAYYSLEFTPLSTDLGDAVRFFVKNMCDIGAEYPITVDYIVAVPTSLIEKHAKRALWNASPMTSTFKSSMR